MYTEHWRVHYAGLLYTVLKNCSWLVHKLVEKVVGAAIRPCAIQCCYVNIMGICGRPIVLYLGRIARLACLSVRRIRTYRDYSCSGKRSDKLCFFLLLSLFELWASLRDGRTDGQTDGRMGETHNATC